MKTLKSYAEQSLWGVLFLKISKNSLENTSVGVSLFFVYSHDF